MTEYTAIKGVDGLHYTIQGRNGNLTWDVYDGHRLRFYDTLFDAEIHARVLNAQEKQKARKTR